MNVPVRRHPFEVRRKARYDGGRDVPSRASSLDCVPQISVPTLVVAYDGDNAVFTYHTDAIYDASRAADKQKVSVAGDHLGYGAAGMSDRSGQQSALDVIVPWIRERF